ncbi:MAG: CBS domain-containing protein [Methylococcaceae bacterium]|nr:CBS domain-containing protein [Methylococcaceae bacterium]MCI0668809.1 CBS domain-containing protein [Methylococcaceae bacterium]MCI0732702.1 CBS domain-containing protein [Methylococcaceae bacterium]
MNTVKQVLKVKGNSVFSVAPETPVYDALTVMAEHGVGALLVLKDQRPVGIFSERDYARKVILKGKSSREITVGELMVKDVFYVSPEDSLNECMVIMTEKRIRHLPVLEENQLVGMISIGDVVKQIISEQEFKIRELEKYIQGSY